MITLAILAILLVGFMIFCVTGGAPQPASGQDPGEGVQPTLPVRGGLSLSQGPGVHLPAGPGPRAVLPHAETASAPAGESDAKANEALRLIDQGTEHVFLTGRAGTGKSTLVRQFLSRTRKKVAVIAPTGIAAMQVGGETIHRFCGFPARPVNSEDIRSLRDKRLIQALDVIVVDEVSMVRSDLLDAVDGFLRKNGRSATAPFGGCQMVFVGDLYQLPPVVKTGEEARLFASRYASEWFFDAHVFDHADLRVISLEKVYRQSDPAYVDLLDRLRRGLAGLDDLDKLNGRVQPPPEHALWLTCTRERAGQVNDERFEALPGATHVYEATVEGAMPDKDDDLPAPRTLRLKVGAQVMFLKNDAKWRWVNGTIGQVAELSAGSVRVLCDGMLYDVEREKWEQHKYSWDPEKKQVMSIVIGRLTQYPLRLAWALTIHKSQGLTLERAHVDFGRGAFAAGQSYVALSRCRTLAGLTLEKRVALADVKVAHRLAWFEDRVDPARGLLPARTSEPAA